MIINGNQRGGAKDLALHLMKDENEKVEIHELRGFLSRDLIGAFNEIYAISRGTKCRKYIYSLSLNPPKDKKVSIADFEDAIEKAEKRLGLEGQPRAIVFHEKDGRRHCHVVWSRIDIKTMIAKQMSHDWRKLTELSRELFRQYGWKMPEGLKKYGERDPTNYTHGEYQQAKRSGKKASQVKEEIQEAWNISDNRIAFEHALAERGYYLAQGDYRNFVAVDEYGEVYSIPKQLPKGINTKQVRERLGSPDDLPSVDDILALIEKKREAEPQQNIDDLKVQALQHLNRYHAAFTFAMANRALKQLIPDKIQRQEIIDELVQSKDLIKIGEQNGLDVHATAEMVALEKSMADNATTMIKTASHPSDHSAVQRAIFNLNNKIAHETDGKCSLSQQQKDAMHHMTNDKQLSLVVGVAGAGKTTIMEGAKEALQSQGYRVLGAAPSGIAASGLKEIGINASTLHSLEYRIELAQKMLTENEGKPLSPKQAAFIRKNTLTNKDVLIIDEAGMVSSRQLANIIELTKQAGAKLVLVGDPTQLQSVEAGSAFRTLLERNESVSLTEVRRQKTDWQREATINLSQGNISDALKAYDGHGCIIKSKDRQSAKAQLVADMMQAQAENPDKSNLVLAYTRKDVADLNTMIKAEMIKSGKVSKDNVSVMVTTKDGDTEKQEIQGFAIGDRILFRENNSEMSVMNGSFGTLKSVKDNKFNVLLDNGKAVSFSPKEYSQLQLGYATTVHKSQGMTVDQAFVLATPHFDRNTSYVALSRHKEDVKLYTNAKDFKNDWRLYNTLGRKSEKLSTLDFTDPIQQEKVPTPEQPKQLSFFQRLKNFFVRGKEIPKSTEKPQTEKWINEPIPKKQNTPWATRSMGREEFIDLKAEFEKRDYIGSKQTKDHKQQHPSLER